MKNIIKMLGIIAFAAVIVFSMSSCPDDSSNGNGTSETSYTVTFNLDGGKIGDSTANVTSTVKSGETVSYLPTPTKNDYNFGDWWTEKNGNGSKFTTTTKVTSNTTVYANWISNNEETGDGSINFSDPKWSNIDVYTVTWENSVISSIDTYNGSNKTFTKVVPLFSDVGGEEAFSAVTNNPAEWNVNIASNKLSVALGTPDKAAATHIIPDNINPSGMKVVTYQSFQDDNGNRLSMYNPNSAFNNDLVVFVYADKAGIVSGGMGNLNLNMDLKAGWNTVIFKADVVTMTISMTTGVPDSNYKWVYTGADGEDNETEDASINFSDPKWSNIDVYTATWENSNVAIIPYSGSNKTFTKVTPLFLHVEGKESFSAVSNNPAGWNINIANNQLSVALGTPDKASPSAFIPDNLKTPTDLKVVLYQGFEDDNGNYIFLADHDIYVRTIFVHADKAGIISGSIEGSSILNINMDLKAGWNTVLYTPVEMGRTEPTTLTTGVPGSNYKWVYTGADDEDSQLPGPVGINELGGKIYDNNFFIISFNTDNSYTLSRRYEEDINIRETGFYSWNASEKTAILVVDKINYGFGLQNKSELIASYIEYLSSIPELTLPAGVTIEQYVEYIMQREFMPPTKYDYVIESDLIKYFGIKITLPDTGTLIAGCAYSQKAATEGFGTHYLLSITFDEALSILTSAYGQAENNYYQQSGSPLSNGSDWVILEFTRYNDFRLTKNESGETTTKTWEVTGTTYP